VWGDEEDAKSPLKCNLPGEDLDVVDEVSGLRIVSSYQRHDSDMLTHVSREAGMMIAP
jgi:hypothetical protein